MRALLTAVVLTLGVGTSAYAQIPQTFENLQVLPRDITRDELMTVMRGFSGALGVRCVYCHMGEDTPNMAGIDFKSDERPTKRIAREMMRMNGTINQTLAALPDRSTPNVGVTCMTCHRGISRPVQLEDSIFRVASARGGVEAVAKYDSLRARYYGRASFDFGQNTLVGVATRLAAAQKHEDALLLLRRNAEAFPQFAGSFMDMGRSYEALGRTAEAITAYRAVLERQPNNAQAQARLRALAPGGRP